jgi:hypothetical protein
MKNPYRWEQLLANRVRFPILKGLQPPFCDRGSRRLLAKGRCLVIVMKMGRSDSAGIQLLPRKIFTIPVSVGMNAGSRKSKRKISVKQTRAN